MSLMESKLQQVWGVDTLEFCTACGVPAVLNHCSHEDAAPWHQLNERQRTQVRRQAMRKAKADRLARTVFTVAS